ncbi:peptidase A2 [Rhodoferax koreense]|uniref:Peptidase A2 n=1 Tax=Rhodoferax koreensis TaxID=1842727 RepID=A0A1P8JUC9_9BURK|nr:TIGR02281 family clan AA aspartic protease [Rhodoferax koreense]APW37352.1 peptidase A2 [Rhodoferax koreense]
MPSTRHRLLAVALAALCGVAQAQSVVLTGILGSKALLLVDGKPPRSVAAGESYLGVKVLSVAGESAVVDVGGQRVTLRMGDSPTQVGAKGAAGGNRIVLTADSRGHFFTAGRINNQAMQFMVDTGASYISLSAAEAERLGIDYRKGLPMTMSTANGSTPGWRVRLAAVRVGDVQLTELEAVVTPASMPFVLLGNNFLTQFQMTRLNDQMVLERRY